VLHKLRVDPTFRKFVKISTLQAQLEFLEFANLIKDCKT
jgi:hypothetical protein